MIAYLNQLRDAVIVHNDSVYFVNVNDKEISIESFDGNIIDDAELAESIISLAISSTYELCKK